MTNEHDPLTKLLSIGTLMSNMCYNGGNRCVIDQNFRERMKDLQLDWDIWYREYKKSLDKQK